MARDQATYDDLLESLAAGTLTPVYLLYGEEDLLVEEAVSSVIAAAVPKDAREFNLDILRGEESDARDIVARASSFPMMAERRAVIVQNVDKLSPKDLEILGSYVEQPSKTTCLVLTGGKIDTRKRPYTIVKRTGTAMEFKPLYDDRIPGWIAGRVKKQKHEITQEACRLLAAYVGTSLRELQNELDKIYIYLGTRTSIGPDDVTAVVGMSKELSIFELQKAVGARDLPRSTEIMERMLDAGGSVPFIIAMLTGYFSTLYRLHDLRRRNVPQQELASEARVSPYFLREYLDAVARFPVHDIERAFEALVGADEQIKTSAADPRQVTQLLLVQLLAPPDAGTA
jgi:DNA polymerase III subunit delta